MVLGVGTLIISLGDAWLPGFMSSDRFGSNIIISRTIHAQEVLLGAIGNGIIELDDARPKDIIDSQGNCLVGRKLGMWGKHIKNDFQNYQEFSLCKRYLPKYVPSKVHGKRPRGRRGMGRGERKCREGRGGEEARTQHRAPYRSSGARPAHKRN